MIYQYAINIEEITDFNQVKILMDNLSNERIIRIEKYHFEKDKIRSLMAEALLRYALQKQFGLEDEEIQFHYSEYGKPFLMCEKVIHFNLSHSGEWVVCAIGDTSVGIDVEITTKTLLPSTYKCFSKREIQLFDVLPEEDQADLFYQIWTLKESFVKNNGKGLSYSFDKFSFEFKNNNIELIQDNLIINDFSFYSKKIDEKHWYALCTEQYEGIEDIIFVNLKELLERK